jgi:hypothetical protein
VAVLLGTFISISGRIQTAFIFIFLFFAYLSISSVFIIPQQVFASIKQSELMENIINQMDDEFAGDVDRSVGQIDVDYNNGAERTRRLKSQLANQRTEIEIKRKFRDLVNSYLESGDVSNAKDSTQRYLKEVRKLLTENYSRFDVSLTDGQHVALFLIYPVESLTTTLRRYDDEQYVLNVCRILNKEMEQWASDTQLKIPEAYTEFLCFLINFYIKNSDNYEYRRLRSEVNVFLSLILKRKNLKGIKKHRDVTVAQVMNIAKSMTKVSILALREREDHKLCSAVGYQFRTCCETVLKDPAGVPKRFIVYLRIIGCELASQDVKYDAVYEGADIGTSTREPAAEILLHLLWLRDKVEGYNKYTNSK